MDIISQRTHKPKIKIIDILSELTGNSAINFQRSSYKYLDEGKCYLLLNLKHVRKIDGLGLMVLEQFINRGGQIRLFNVGTEIRCMLEMSGKESLFKVYNETDCHEVVSMFEEENLEEASNKDGIRKRHYPRVDTFFQVVFKYHPGHNGVISGKATIRDLSEGGAFAGQITAVNTENGETMKQSDMIGHELYDIKFRLNEHSGPIETRGECLRGIKEEGEYHAGIRFKDMKQSSKKVIRDFVINTCNT